MIMGSDQKQVYVSVIVVVPTVDELDGPSGADVGVGSPILESALAERFEGFLPPKNILGKRAGDA